jgi:hypothetical protein
MAFMRVGLASFGPRVVLTAAAALFCACAPEVFPEDDLPFYEERPVYGTFDAPFNVAWDASLSAMEQKFQQVEIAERTRGLIVTEWILGQSDYVFSNYGGTRIPVKVKYKVQVRLTSSGNRTTIRVTTTEKVLKDVISGNLEFNGRIFEWIDIPSSTAKEIEIIERIQQGLQRKRSAGRTG